MLGAAPQSEGDRRGAVAAAGWGHPPQDGRAGRRAGQGRELRLRRHGGVRRGPGQEFLFPRNEHAPAGRASGHRTRHRHRSGGADDPRRRRRKAGHCAEGRDADGLGGGIARLCRRSVPQFPALDRTPGEIPSAGGSEPWRHYGAQRHRRGGGRRDLDLLRSDDRQARHSRSVACGGDRSPVERARRVLYRRYPPQYSVPVGADASSALAQGRSLDRLHRRGVSPRVQRPRARGQCRALHCRGRRRRRSCAG